MPRRPPLTPEQRSQRATIASLASHVGEDPQARTGPARAGSPASLTYWQRKVREDHPDLPDAEIDRRADILHRLHMTRLAFKSSRARQARAAERRARRAREAPSTVEEEAPAEGGAA